MKDTLPALTCPNCSHENLEDAKFCQNCGQALDRICTNCDTQNEVGAKYCRACGKALDIISPATYGARLTALQQSAPDGLQEKMRASGSQIEGERKPVTILFADIVGSTSIAEQLDPEEWKEIVSGAHRRVSEAIYRYEGTIAQLLGDGVLAFFGAPITHEDDPIRAVHAALHIQASVSDYERELSPLLDNFQMRIGINTGEVVVGHIGTDLHMEYLAIGDAVNLAARLQSAAEPGKVLLSDQCARLVSTKFDLEDLGKIGVKGKKDPLSVFEVVGVKAEPERRSGVEGVHTPLVGRERELESLKESLISLCRGHGQILAVTGEAGIGKSRLVEEVQTLATNDLGMAKVELESDLLLALPSTLHWLESRALSYGGSLSYWTVTQLLLADLGLSNGAPEVKIKVALRQRIETLLGEKKADVLPLLVNLLGLSKDKETEELIQSIAGENLKQQTLTAIKDYFAAVFKEQPTILVFEDMHWVDPSSLEALEHLLTYTDRTPLMILMLMRIEHEHGSWGVKQRAETDFAHRFKQIHLKRLLSTDAEYLMNYLLGIAELPKEVQDLILTRSEGNPFYLEEIINHLLEQELIVQDEEGWHASDEITEIGIPETLQGVLLARIDRLEADVRVTLQMASVIGKSFLYKILEAISEAERELDEHLSQLQRVDLVREKAHIPELEYMFRHSLTQEAAYNSLLHERRREFHLKVGESLEILFADRSEEFYGLLAHHFEAAEAQEKAMDYLVRAGDQARLAYAHEEAIAYYRRALTILKDTEEYEQSAKTLMKLGLTYHNTFDFQQAREAFNESFAIRQRASTARSTARPPAPHAFRQVERVPPTLDPSLAGDVTSHLYIANIFSGLVELGSTWEIIPDVAQNWEIFEGGRKYIFHLQDDVYWSDGIQVTAADFEYAWKRTLNPATEASGGPARILYDIKNARAYHMGNISDPDQVGIRSHDPLILEVELERPASYFLHILASKYPVPKHVVEVFGDAWTDLENIVTNGPFQLEAWKPGESNVRVKNPTYKRRFSGNLQRIEAKLSVSPASSEELEMYESDNIDIALLGAETYNARHKYAGDYVSQPYPGTNYVAFDSSRPPFDDHRVRQAFVMAVDRESLAGQVLQGLESPALGGFVPPALPGYSSRIGLLFDTIQARRLLNQAGYPDGQGFPSVEFLSSHYMDDNVVEYLKAQWLENLNINVSLIMSKSSEFFESKMRSTNLLLAGWMSDYPDPDNFLRVCVKSYVPNWQNENYDHLLLKAQQTSSQDDRISLYQAADKILIEDAAIMPIIYSRNHILVKPWVKFPAGGIGPWNLKDVIIEPH